METALTPDLTPTWSETPAFVAMGVYPVRAETGGPWRAGKVCKGLAGRRGKPQAYADLMERLKGKMDGEGRRERNVWRVRGRRVGACPEGRCVKNGLHLSLAKEIIRLFTSEESNPHHAQLICTSHQPLLLDGNFRRDQVWVTCKDSYERSSMHRMSELKTSRAQVNLANKILEVPKGAIRTSSLQQHIKTKKKKHRVAARCLRDDKSTDLCALPHDKDIVSHPVSVRNMKFVSRKVKKT